MNLEVVKDYYGKVLTTSKDLKNRLSSPTGWLPRRSNNQIKIGAGIRPRLD
jgi:hypothetical protein